MGKSLVDAEGAFGAVQACGWFVGVVGVVLAVQGVADPRGEGVEVLRVVGRDVILVAGVLFRGDVAGLEVGACGDTHPGALQGLILDIAVVGMPEGIAASVPGLQECNLGILGDDA